MPWAGSTTNPALTVVGQKRPAGRGLILWVQNVNFTWKNSVDGVAVAPQSGTVTVPGFAPGTTISLEQWDTHAPGGRVISTQNVTADTGGSVHITVTALQTDTAFKARPSGGVPPAQPTLLKIIH